MYIVEGRDMKTMRRVYYTGRAGAGWLSERRSEAFCYATEAEAELKARLFKRQHRSPFWATFANPDDAHAAGARAMSEEACGQ